MRAPLDDSRPACAVCATTDGVSPMTDGRQSVHLCDDCRPNVVTFFHIHRDLKQATDAVSQMRGR